MGLNKDLLEQYLNKCQDILRLRDWDIKIELVFTGAEEKEISFGRIQKEVDKELGSI